MPVARSVLILDAADAEDNETATADRDNVDASGPRRLRVHMLPKSFGRSQQGKPMLALTVLIQ